MKYINLMLSDDLHSRFKQYCAKKDVKMKDALVIAIEKIIQSNKK